MKTGYLLYALYSTHCMSFKLLKTEIFYNTSYCDGIFENYVKLYGFHVYGFLIVLENLIFYSFKKYIWCFMKNFENLNLINMVVLHFTELSYDPEIAYYLDDFCLFAS